MDVQSLSTETINNTMNDIRPLWTKNNQGQVFEWVDKLDSKTLSALLEDLTQIDVAEVNKIYQTTARQEEEEKNTTHDVQPFPDVTRLNDASAEQRAQWRNNGLNLIADCKVGVLLLAGGQASRLGCVMPKGTYDLGLPSKKSLFQLQVERSVKLQKIAAQHKGIDSCHIPWYIMTSPATYVDTVAFFHQNNFFGEPKENFFFFNQGTLPCLRPNGMIINESGGKVAQAPNGNGGLYLALAESGALADMRKRGLQYISQFCVDNAIVRVADPTFIGFMVDTGSDCAAKVTAKAYPAESVGVMCLMDGKPSVVEYSEISPDMRVAVNPTNNELVYNFAHLCINNFTVDFLQRIADNHLDALRYHVARKKIAYANEDGETTPSTVENGWKLERFIFDAFAFANKMVAFECRRDEEFSPLKNGAGMAVPKDSPETCLADLLKLGARFIEQAGGKVESEGEDVAVVDVSPLTSYAGEDMEFVKGKTFQCPVSL